MAQAAVPLRVSRGDQPSAARNREGRKAGARRLCCRSQPRRPVDYSIAQRKALDRRGQRPRAVGTGKTGGRVARSITYLGASARRRNDGLQKLTSSYANKAPAGSREADVTTGSIKLRDHSDNTYAGAQRLFANLASVAPGEQLACGKR